MNEPLTATEIEQGLKDLPKLYPESTRKFEQAQAAFYGPLIKKTIEIMRNQGIEIPDET